MLEKVSGCPPPLGSEAEIGMLIAGELAKPSNALAIVIMKFATQIVSPKAAFRVQVKFILFYHQMYLYLLNSSTWFVRQGHIHEHLSIDLRIE